MNTFDVIVLTAANEAQAKGYRAQLAWRKEKGLLASGTRALAVADPGDRRVGSLGATLHVLSLLRKEFGASFSSLRILICHSGGDSRRTPAYAAQGKVFTPVPCTSSSGEPLALFDLILRTCEALPFPSGGQVLITSGDVLLTFDHASVDFSRPGMTGVAYFGPVSTGARHGVYVPDSFPVQSSQTVCATVADFLQKPTENEACAAGAVDPYGHEAIDTGILRLDAALCERLLTVAGDGRKNGLLADIRDGSCPALDVYEELTMAMAPGMDERRFLLRSSSMRGADARHQRRMRAFYRALHVTPFHVNLVPYCEFFHIGSSAELLSGFSGLSRTAQLYHFANGCGSAITGQHGESGAAFVFHSCINVPVKTGGPSLLEAVDARHCGPLFFAGDNILTGLPPEVTVPVSLPRGTGLVCLPVGAEGWAAVVYGLQDTFKTAFTPSSPDCTFLNTPLADWMASHGVAASRLWKRGEEKDGLWCARLWTVGSIDAVLRAAQDLFAPISRVSQGLTKNTASRHYSLAELIPLVNHERLLSVRQEIRRQVNLACVAERIRMDVRLSAEEVCGQIRTAEEARSVLQRLEPLLADARPLFRARVFTLMAAIRAKTEKRDVSAPPFSAEAFSAVAEEVAMDFAPAKEPGRAAILQDQVVWVTTPVRIDFAGGWTDTPPICTECGGTVLNAAVTLNGLYPIQVMVKLNDLGLIRLSSIDLGERKEIRTTEELLDHHDPHDWSALAKAAMVLTGIGPSDPHTPLTPWLNALGGGLDLTIFSSLPKGSGMGTSSILGAAVIAGLSRVLGLPFNTDRIIRLTSVLEQRMSTGGGWQDQVGGILPGVKLIRTEAGSDQTVTLRWSDCNLLEDRAFKNRCLLYFTGQKRMARNILQNVVARFLARDPNVLNVVGQLRDDALETKEALDAKDVDAFAGGIAKYWELKKRIDPGATNAPIERLLASVRKDTLAALLPGAGGGGFIFLIAKDEAAAERIRVAFTRRPLNGHARFFDFAIDRQGLKVTVL